MVARRNTPRARLEKHLDDLWSSVVKIRDGRCRKCGHVRFVCERRTGIEAHHIYARSNRATRWDPRNGITLCESLCHPWAERNPKAFEKWIIKEIGQDLFNELGALARGVKKHSTEELNRIKKGLQFFLQ